MDSDSCNISIRRFIPHVWHAVKYSLVSVMVCVGLMVIYRISTCHNENRGDNYQVKNASSHSPYIYVITPTYTRSVQKADLTRLSQTLRLVPNLHWILVEDSKNKTELVTNFLARCNLSYTHLAVTDTKKDATRRGILQRNAALTWLRANNVSNGVVYFADDDNTYDVRLFEEMRYTKKVAVWPVGLISHLRAEGCIVTNGKFRASEIIGLCYAQIPKILQTKIERWFASYAPERKYAIDMAGFAVNLRLIQDKPDAWWGGEQGFMETYFLSKIGVEVNDLEPKADNCTKVLVWHTRTEQESLSKEALTLKQHGLSSSLFKDV